MDAAVGAGRADGGHGGCGGCGAHGHDGCGGHDHGGGHAHGGGLGEAAAAGRSTPGVDERRRASLATLGAGALAAAAAAATLAAPGRGHAAGTDGATGGGATGGGAGGTADRPVAGDWLVPSDGDGGAALKASDLKLGDKQRIVLPWDPAAGRRRDGSRLNRLLVIRLDPAELDADTRARAADGGVVAYSAVCTHQACEVSAWKAAEKTLLCFCHFSQFAPQRAGAVTAGPAPRPLPALPLAVEAASGRLVLAGGFNVPPGSSA